ncbi:YbhB/YbcL family Raf kinase inhibitor-like protein [bacterium]|nr:YbhB/YbcL family Raf kinase inhibitor-like protein [bacterium]
MGDLKLTSLEFEEGKKIPAKYTCDGEDVSPPLAIAGVSDEAKSLVLIMDDPDVPKNLRPDGMWDHWVVFNISPDTTEISEGEEPQGVHGKGTSGNLKYHGPCPPDKEHRYFFKLYALDTELDLNEGVTKAEVEKAMEGHVLEQAELVGLYERG